MHLDFLRWQTAEGGDVSLIPLMLAVACFTMLAAIVEIIRHRRGRTPLDSPLMRTLRNSIAAEREAELPWTWKDYAALVALLVVVRRTCRSFTPSKRETSSVNRLDALTQIALEARSY
jgi:hypothetical protein